MGALVVEALGTLLHDWRVLAYQVFYVHRRYLVGDIEFAQESAELRFALAQAFAAFRFLSVVFPKALHRVELVDVLRLARFV